MERVQSRRRLNTEINMVRQGAGKRRGWSGMTVMSAEVSSP
jgi:hypothetical protein